MSDQITLAPAAGSGIGKLLAERLLRNPELLTENMEAVIERGFNATKRLWDSGSRQWVEEPDMRSQLQTLFGVLAHMEGEPIKRIIHQHLGGSGAIDPLAALRESPELREAARDLIAKSEWRNSGRQSHKAPKPADAPLEVD